MIRKWSSFDTAITNAELLRVPQPDRRALTLAMARYRDELVGGYIVRNYGEGLFMIKATNGTSGRCLFFSVKRIGDEERLVALLFYKKESDDAPESLVAAARRRKDRYLEER